MATLTVRGIPDQEKEVLRIRAARNGHSMEAELRLIIREALVGEIPRDIGLATAIRRRFAPFEGVELPELPRVVPPEPPTFE